MNVMLSKIYEWLGKEYQDVFILISQGFTLAEIGRYWKGIHPDLKTKDDRSVGQNVVDRLISRVDWLSTLSTREISAHQSFPHN
jgi:hypothetical protein